MLNKPPSKFLIKNFIRKNKDTVNIINIGRNLRPSFSFPLDINPKINEPMIEVKIRDVIVYVLTNFGLMEIFVNASGSCAETVVGGN